MGRLMRAVAGFLTALAVVVTPAMLSACVALCMPGMAGHAMANGPAVAPAATHHAMTSPAPSLPACAEHVLPAPAPVTTSQVNGADTPCCADRLASADVFVTAARSDTHGVAAPLMTARPSWAPAVQPGSPAPPRRLSAPPPAPPHRPSVLRI